MIIGNVSLQSTCRVPYLARFYIYARKFTPDEVSVRILGLTEPERAEHPLELQEDYVEIARSEDIEVNDKAVVNVRFSGNLLKCENSAEAVVQTILGEPGFRFKPFFECRAAYSVKRRNETNPYAKGKVTLFTGMDHVLFEAKVDLTKFL